MELTTNFFLQLALGLALFSFGWTLFHYGIKAIGFGLGFMAGYSTYELVLDWVPRINESWMQYFPQHPLAAVLAGVVLGVAAMFLAQRMYMLVIYVGVFAGALYIFNTTDQRELIERGMVALNIYAPIQNTLGDLWPVLLALLIAGVFVFFQKQIVILVTACAGSYLIVDAINVPWLLFPLCFIGYFLQQKTKKRKRPKPKEEDEE